MAGLIIALLIGSGAGYIYGQSPIAGYKEEVDRLEAENLGIREKKAQLLEENAALQDQLEVVTTNLSSTRSSLKDLQKENNQLSDQYEALIATLDAYGIKNWTRTISYNITAGTEKTWTFLIPKYNIFWEATISFSSTYVSMIHSWRMDDKRGFVGSSGLSLDCEARPYGPQKFLFGTIKVDYYDDGKGRVWVNGSILTQFPDVSQGGTAYFDIPV